MFRLERKGSASLKHSYLEEVPWMVDPVHSLQLELVSALHRYQANLKKNQKTDLILHFQKKAA